VTVLSSARFTANGLPEQTALAQSLTLAQQAYGERCLSSGEAMMAHALGMAMQVAELRMDAECRIAALLFGVVFTLPNVLPQKVLEQAPAWLPHQKLNLGLDLQGGSYLLLEVDVPAMREKRVTNLIEDVRVTLNGEGIATNGLQRAAGGVSHEGPSVPS
jgi:hypothetical protein